MDSVAVICNCTACYSEKLRIIAVKFVQGESTGNRRESWCWCICRKMLLMMLLRNCSCSWLRTPMIFRLPWQSRRKYSRSTKSQNRMLWSSNRWQSTDFLHFCSLPPSRVLAIDQLLPSPSSAVSFVFILPGLPPFVRQHPSYGDSLEVRRKYYQNFSVLDCVTQCSVSMSSSYRSNRLGSTLWNSYAMLRNYGCL